MPSSASEASFDGESLARLRRQVMRAAETLLSLQHDLDALRSENEQLRLRIHELEDNPGLNHDGTLLPLDDDPSDLRSKVESFIEAIDAHLAESAPNASK